MEVLSIRNKFATALGSTNDDPCEAGVAGESNLEMCDDSLKVPLMTDDEECFSTTSKENHAGTVKHKLAMVVGAVKAKAPLHPGVSRVKDKLVKLSAGTMSEARSAVKLGAGTMRSVQEHLQVALYGKAADSDCIETLSALGFSRNDIEDALLQTGTEDVAELETFLRRTQANDDIAVEKLLAMGFAHKDVIKAVRKTGAQNLELIVGKLCNLQDKRLQRAQGQNNARRFARSLHFCDSTAIVEEDSELAAKLSKCFGDCNSQLAICLGLLESRHEELENKVSDAPWPCVDAMDTQIAAS